MRKIIVEATLIFLIAAALSAAGYLWHHDTFNPLSNTSSPDGTDEDHLFKVISLERAREMFLDGTALFVDARPAVAYDAGHIQGAIHLPPDLFDQWSAEILTLHPADRPIIAYCEGIHCTLSHELAEKLTWLGFEQVYYLVDGWGRWKAQGWPAE